MLNIHSNIERNDIRDKKSYLEIDLVDGRTIQIQFNGVLRNPHEFSEEEKRIIKKIMV